jgi:probable rRNA maturation factor
LKRAAPARRPRRPAKAPIRIDILVRSPRWRATARATVRKAIHAAAQAVSTPQAELAIVLTDDSTIRSLNRDWRGKDTPTNVLSFPAAPPGKGRSASLYIGDIVIAHETTKREAAAEGKPFSHHLAHLTVHGFLHLLGHDHDNDRDANRMERLERRILARLSIPDPYGSQHI